jgi:hypothetical protein
VSSVVTRIEPSESPSAPVQRDLKVYMHSPLLYWWPVWAIGFLMALWTFLANQHMVLVPQGTAVAARSVVVPEGESMSAVMVHVARSPAPGAIFVTVLLAVIVFSNVSLRGIWSLFAAMCLVAFALLLSWMQWWGTLFEWMFSFRVYLNLGAYLVISVPLFVIWAASVFFFDRRTYLVFSLSQIRVRDELGGEERAFDAGTVAFEKRPFDWFRWLVGRGAGDLIIRVGGATPQTFELTNVTNVSERLDALEQRLRTRDVV